MSSMKWRSVKLEPAPIDGEPFLVAIPSEWMGKREWLILRARWNASEQKFVDATYDPLMNSAEGFTRWMPMPEPPSE